MELTAIIALATLRCTPTDLFNAEEGAILVTRALGLAEELQDRAARAKILWIEMHLYRLLDDLKHAYDVGMKSLSISRAMNLSEQTAFTLHDLGYVLTEMGRVLEAMRFFAEAGELWRRLDNLPMLADNLAGTTTVLFFTGRYEEAISSSDEAFRISQQTKNPWGQSHSRMSLGFVYRDLGQYDRALEAARVSLQFAEESGFSVPKIFCPAQIALAYGDLGEFSRGEEIAREIMEIAEESPYAETHVLSITALIHNLIAAGDLRQAEELHKQMATPQQDDDYAAFLFGGNLKLLLHLRLNQPEKVLSHSERLFDRVKDIGAAALAPEVHFLRGMAYMELGEYDKAREELGEARERAEEIDQRRTLWKILSALAELEDKQGNVDHAVVLKGEARSIIEYIVDHSPSDMRATILALPEVRDIWEPGS
jgi:tetratricopeptide (TPR) repeat protein